MKKFKFKSAEEIQDKIFKKMSAEIKLKLASDFSMFLLKLNKLKDDRFLKIAQIDLKYLKEQTAIQSTTEIFDKLLERK